MSAEVPSPTHVRLPSERRDVLSLNAQQSVEVQDTDLEEVPVTKTRQFLQIPEADGSGVL